MTQHSHTAACLGLALFTLLVPTSCRTAQRELTPEDLLENAHEAYRRFSAFDVTMTTVVELPGSDPAERIVRYRLGQENHATIEIGSLMRIVATDGKFFLERKDVAERYLEMPYGGDLGELTKVDLE